MCALYSRIALASLLITCGSIITIVILLRHLLASGITSAFTLPHVALLHSVTFTIYKGWAWWRSVLHLVFFIHYPIPYSTITLSLSCLHRVRLLTLYSLLSTLQSTTPSPFTLPIVNTILPAPLSLTCNGSSCVLSHTQG